MSAEASPEREGGLLLGSAKPDYRWRRGPGRSWAPLLGLIPCAALLAAWQVAGTKGSTYFPPPSQWISALRVLWDQGNLIGAVGGTVGNWILGLVVSTVLGTALGLLIGRARFWDKTLGPFLEFCRVMPAAAVVPVVVLMAGYTVKMQLVVVTFGAIWPPLLAVRSAAQATPPQRLDTARALRMGRWAVIRKVLFPSVIPAILIGVRIATPMALVLTLLVEILTQVGGIGSLMITAEQNYASDQLYGLMCVAGVLGFLASIILGQVGRLARHYGSTM